MKENKKLKPFVVDITEEYRKSVIIWAEDQEEADEIADDLCGEGVIEFDVENFAERTVQPGYKVKTLEDCRYYEEYDSDGRINGRKKIHG